MARIWRGRCSVASGSPAQLSPDHDLSIRGILPEAILHGIERIASQRVVGQLETRAVGDKTRLSTHRRGGGWATVYAQLQKTSSLPPQSWAYKIRDLLAAASPEAFTQAIRASR